MDPAAFSRTFCDLLGEEIKQLRQSVCLKCKSDHVSPLFKIPLSFPLLSGWRPAPPRGPGSPAWSPGSRPRCLCAALHWLSALALAVSSAPTAFLPPAPSELLCSIAPSGEPSRAQTPDPDPRRRPVLLSSGAQRALSVSSTAQAPCPPSAYEQHVLSVRLLAL